MLREIKNCGECQSANQAGQIPPSAFRVEWRGSDLCAECGDAIMYDTQTRYGLCAKCILTEGVIERRIIIARGQARPEEVTDALKTFARNACCNYDKSRKACLRRSDCLIFEGLRCDYFEGVLLKMAVQDGLKQIAKDYRVMARGQGQLPDLLAGNTCNGCGEPIAARKRYCDGCRLARRRDADRRRKEEGRRIGGRCPQLS